VLFDTVRDVKAAVVAMAMVHAALGNVSCFGPFSNYGLCENCKMEEAVPFEPWSRFLCTEAMYM
jgi:hypothetical protein